MANTIKNNKELNTETLRKRFACGIQGDTLSIADKLSRSVVLQVKIIPQANSLTTHLFALELMNDILRYLRQVDSDTKLS